MADPINRKKKKKDTSYSSYQIGLIFSQLPMNLHKEMSRETPLRIIGDSFLKYAASQQLFTMSDDARTHVKQEQPDPELLPRHRFDPELLHPSSIVDLLSSNSSSLDDDCSNAKKRKVTEKGFDGGLPVGFLDHVRVHPRFLHSNATSHKWVLGSKMLMIEDNGSGMDPMKCITACHLGIQQRAKHLKSSLGKRNWLICSSKQMEVVAYTASSKA